MTTGEQPERRGRRVVELLRRDVSWHAVLRAAGLVVVATIGALVGLLLLGQRTEQIGPLTVRTQVVLSWTGDTVIEIPPLGTVSLDTHDGPLSLRSQVESVDLSAAQSLLNDRSAPATQQEIVAAARRIIWQSVIQGLLGAVVGASLMVLAVYRRPRLATQAALAVLVLFAAGALVGGATWNDRALAQPRYTGLLTYAPRVVGDADQVVGNIHLYGEQLASLVNNVSKLSAAVVALPTTGPTTNSIRVLQVSDIHLNPNVWPIMRTIIKQYNVDFVIDSGDIADHGTTAEIGLLDGIKTLGVPYVYARGNHDSSTIESAIDAMPNTTVLRGSVVTVDGLSILGSGDPRFTPDKSTTADEASVIAQGERLARVAAAQPDPVDVVVVHDPAAAPALAGLTPLVLAGHVHERRDIYLGNGTRLLVQGSSGGAGLRALQSEAPTPLTFTVLYFSPDGALQVRDEITLGGVGLTSAEVKRIVTPVTPPLTPPTPSPSPGSGSMSPAAPG
ncbi:MAG: metallophosphoesterase [Actinomycetes bacterium]